MAVMAAVRSMIRKEGGCPFSEKIMVTKDLERDGDST
jgi:hypothetical protein